MKWNQMKSCSVIFFNSKFIIASHLVTKQLNIFPSLMLHSHACEYFTQFDVNEHLNDDIPIFLINPFNFSLLSNLLFYFSGNQLSVYSFWIYIGEYFTLSWTEEAYQYMNSLNSIQFMDSYFMFHMW